MAHTHVYNAMIGPGGKEKPVTTVEEVDIGYMVLGRDDYQADQAREAQILADLRKTATGLRTISQMETVRLAKDHAEYFPMGT